MVKYIERQISENLLYSGFHTTMMGFNIPYP